MLFRSLEVARYVAMAANAPCTISLNNPSGGEFAPDKSKIPNSCLGGTTASPLQLATSSQSKDLSVSVISNNDGVRGDFPITFTPEGTIRDGVTVLLTSPKVTIGGWCVDVQAPLATVRRGWRATGGQDCNYAIEQ